MGVERATTYMEDYIKSISLVFTLPYCLNLNNTLLNPKGKDKENVSLVNINGNSQTIVQHPEMP